MEEIRNNLMVGDVIIESDKLEMPIKWVDCPKDIIIVDIYEMDNGFTVAELNCYYKHSDDQLCNTVLIKNIEKDVIRTRELLIDEIINS